MSKGTAIDLGLNEVYNDLFSTQAERDNAQCSYVIDLPTTEISDFPDHPFKVRMDESMMELADSVKQHGILVPSLVRPAVELSYLPEIVIFTIVGTGRAVKSVAFGRNKKPPTFPAPPLTDSGDWGQGGTQASVQGQNGGAEPFADQRVGDTPRADTFLTVIQKQTVPAIVVVANLPRAVKT